MAVVDDEIDFIDKKSKTIHFVSGKIEPLGEDASFSLFSSPAQRGIEKDVETQELESYEKGVLPKSSTAFIKSFTGSNVFSKLATDYLLDPSLAAYSAIDKREGQEDSGFFDRAGENYIAQRRGRRSASKKIAEENPGATKAGSIAALGTDLFMPTGRLARSPTATGAVFGAGSSDRSLFEDPEQFAKSTAAGGAIGYGAGKVGSALERVAGERRAIREFPEVERQAQRAHQQQIQNFRSSVVEKLGAVQKDLGPYGISKTALEVDNFLAREIGVSSQAGTREANEVESFLRNLEKNLPDSLQAGDLQRMYEAIEIRAVSSPESIQPVFQKFKEHLVERLPLGAAQNKLMGKIFPRIEKQTAKVIDQAFDKFPKNIIKELETEYGKGAVQKMKESLKSDLSQNLKQMSTEEFVSYLEKGNADTIINILKNNPTYQGMADFASYKIMQNHPGQNSSFQGALKRSLPSSVFEAETRMQQLPSQIQQKIENIMRKNASEASILVDETQRKISSRISNATGIQNPYVTRAPTNTPVGAYNAPQRQQAGRMAERFESTPLGASRAGNEAFGLGAAGKLFGVPKLGAALAVGKGVKTGLEGTLRGLTSPSALGNFARQSIQGGGLKLLVEQISYTYPSYEKGVIKNPQERKAAVFEIETDSDLEIEDKAQLQAYINRGKNLELLFKE